jgi:coenzyme F420-reducing hydrogenase alpha subunit
MRSKKIKTDYLARVEGEGGFHINIEGGRITDVKLNIFEPPRLFEAFLEGRSFREAPDITARICGICPVAYAMSAVHAMEDACGVGVGAQIRSLRRLLYCGEWLESHALHVYMLHAPDFLGYENALAMAKDHPQAFQRGMDLKKVGNAIVALLGGREIHPINVRVGGFYKAPSKEDLASLEEKIKRALDAALETVRWTAAFPFLDFNRNYEFVALSHPEEYPMNEGQVISSKGLRIPVSAYDNHFVEIQEPHSTALHSVIEDRGAYFVGPLARFNCNFDLLSPLAREAARSAGLSSSCHNPFQSIIVRGVEMVYACDEALRLLRFLGTPDKPAVEVEPRAGTGYSCTEAPRGILYHRYHIDDKGRILHAKIVPPTSQNQKIIESDLKAFAEANINLPQEQITRKCEQLIRSYDPCISCSVHLLHAGSPKE